MPRVADREAARADLDCLDDGNIYILLPDRLTSAWGGVRSGDYDRACAASDPWLNTLPVDDGAALILGGDPGMALVVPEQAGETDIVRWMFADDEHARVPPASDVRPSRWASRSASPTMQPGGRYPVQQSGLWSVPRQ